MGLGNSSNKIYITVADGKFVMRVNEDMEGAKSRVTKTGKIVHEIGYSNFTGVLNAISIKEETFNNKAIKNWIFDFSDEGDNYQLQVMYDSRYATSLLFALCNPTVDFSAPLRLNAWMKEIDGKKKTAIYVNQGEGKNNRVDWYFTKDDRKGMPEMVQTKFKGELVWDSFDMMQFLEAFVFTNVAPLLNNHIENEKLPPMYTKQGGVVDKSGYSPLTLPENDDDLPF